MEKRQYWLLLISTIAAGLIGGVLSGWFFSGRTAVAEEGTIFENTSPGNQRYRPTRIEWLAVELQAKLGTKNLAYDRFTLSIAKSLTVPDTLVVNVRYLPDVDPRIMYMAVQYAKNATTMIVAFHGWHNWVKITESVMPTEE